MRLVLTKNKIFILLSIIVGVMACSFVYAESPIRNDELILSDVSAPLSLGRYIKVFDDRTRRASWDSVEAGLYAREFKLNEAGVYVGRESNSRYWFKLAFNVGQTILDDKAILYLRGQPILILLGEISIKSNGKSTHYKFGINEPLSARPITSNFYAFPIELTLGDRVEIIGFVDNYGGAQVPSLPFFIASEERYLKDEFRKTVALVCFYAMMAALLFYNACLLLTLRERVYGYYFVFLLSAVYTCAGLDGSVAHWTPLASSINYSIGLRVNGVITVLMYTAFVFNALDRVSFLPIYKKLYFLMMGLGLMLLALLMTGFLINIKNFVAPVMVVNLIIIIYAIRRKNPIAPFLLVAEGCAMVGGAIFSMTLVSESHSTLLSQFAMHEGLLAEALMLSLALAGKTRTAQSRAIDYLENYKKLFEDSNEALIEYNIVEKRFNCNTAFARLFGFSNKVEMMESYTPERGNFLDRDIFDLLVENNGEVTDYEYAINLENPARTIWVALTLRLIKDSYHRPEIMEGSMVDITERKLKEEAEKLSLANIQKSDKQKNEFLATISHELLTPMNGIVGHLELLNSYQHSEQASKRLSSIDSATKEMMLLINRVLDFTQDQADQSDFPVDSTLGDSVDIESDQRISEVGIEPVARMKAAKDCRILIVEDNATNSLVLKGVLKKLGHNAVVVENGVQALEVLGHESIGLIFMDCQMPVMDGFEATKRIRERKDELRNLPIVAVTANAMRADRDRCAEVGMDDFVTKPISKNKISEVLDKWLS